MKILVLVASLLVSNVFADQIVHKFKSPSFSGIGTSSHYLTIENQQKSRRDKIQEDVESIYQKTGGHPLALELFELYGQSLHVDWLQFIDDEILFKLPNDEQQLLSELAHSNKPLPWQELAQRANWSGPPPKSLISYGILIELDEGMWLHEALRERLLRTIK